MAGNAKLGFASETSGLELNKTSGLEGPGTFWKVFWSANGHVVHRASVGEADSR